MEKTELLMNDIFKKKREKIDDFIENEYGPKLLEEFIKLIPEGTDLKAELPNILKELISIINKERSRMQNLLEERKVKVINQKLKSWNLKLN